MGDLTTLPAVLTQAQGVGQNPFAPAGPTVLPGYPLWTRQQAGPYQAWTGLINPFHVPRSPWPLGPFSGDAAGIPGGRTPGPATIHPGPTGPIHGGEGEGDDDGGDDDDGDRFDPAGSDTPPGPGDPGDGRGESGPSALDTERADITPGGWHNIDPRSFGGGSQPGPGGRDVGPGSGRIDRRGDDPGGDANPGGGGRSDSAGTGGDGGRAGEGPSYRRGGIVTRPTRVTVGERGKDEAIVPLQHPRFSPGAALRDILARERRTRGYDNPRRGGLPRR